MAFADLAAGMVLSVSADTSRIQEEINSLCETAQDAFGDNNAELFATLFAGGKEPGVFEAIFIEGQQIGIFLRSTVQQNDAFCCVCTTRISLAEFVPAARAALDRL